jgi:hypothetical protein
VTDYLRVSLEEKRENIWCAYVPSLKFLQNHRVAETWVSSDLRWCRSTYPGEALARTSKNIAALRLADINSGGTSQCT